MKKVQFLVLLTMLGCTTEPDTEIPEDTVDFEAEWEAEESDDGSEELKCPDTWVLTYALEGKIDITHTPLNIGNAEAFVGGLDSDELVIRLADNNGAPANGQVLMTSFELLQDFTVSVNMLGEIAIITDLHMTSSNECGIAIGNRIDSSIRWDDCNFGPEHGTTKWDPNDGAYGPGCIQDYKVEGLVECVDESLLASCEDGWLNEGENNFSYTYNQPMLSLEFDSNELESFTMKGTQYGTEMPTNTNNRIWMTLEGSLKSKSLEPTPDCLCSE